VIKMLLQILLTVILVAPVLLAGIYVLANFLNKL